MRKDKLRSTLRHLLPAIDETNKYHNLVLDSVLENAINTLIYQAHEQNSKALGQYTKRYSVIGLTTDGERYNYPLTVSLVPLPDKRGGVRDVFCNNISGAAVYCVPLTDQEFGLLWNSQVKSLRYTDPIIVYYTPRPTVVEFLGLSTPALLNGTYYFDLIVAFTSLADTDQVPLPYGKDTEVLKMALEILGVVQPKDLLDNNSDLK